MNYMQELYEHINNYVHETCRKTTLSCDL